MGTTGDSEQDPEIRRLQVLVAENPSASEYLEQLALKLHQKGRTLEAEPLVRELIQRGHNVGTNAGVLFIILTQSGRYSEAVRMWQLAVGQAYEGPIRDTLLTLGASFQKMTDLAVASEAGTTGDLSATATDSSNPVIVGSSEAACERFACRALRQLFDYKKTHAELGDSYQLRDFLAALEFLVPSMFAAQNRQWSEGGISNFRLFRSVRAGPWDAEFAGLATLDRDRSWVPFLVRATVAEAEDRFDPLEVHLGELGSSTVIPNGTPHSSPEIGAILKILPKRLNEVRWTLFRRRPLRSD